MSSSLSKRPTLASSTGRPTSFRRRQSQLQQTAELHVVHSSDEEKKENWLERLATSVVTQCQDEFNENIPHEYIKLLETKTKIAWGTFLYLSLITLGVVIFILLYSANLDAVYLSPTFNRNCIEVDRPVSESFLGDLDGHWQNTAAFDSTLAIYSFSLSNFSTFGGAVGDARGDWSSVADISLSLSSTKPDAEMTLTQLYAYLMTKVGRQMETYLSKIMSAQNTAENLLYLMYWSVSAFTGQAQNRQVFSFTGNPTAVISNLQFQTAGLGNGHVSCNLDSTTSFDPGTHLWTVSFNANAFSENENCTRVMPFLASGYVSPALSLSFSIDVRSFFACVAANFPRPRNSEQDSTTNLFYYQWGGIKRISYARASNSSFTGVGGGGSNGTVVKIGTPGRNYLLNQYYDPRYPGMAPIYCVEKEGATRDYANASASSRLTCFLKLNGGMFVYPLFSHFGEESGIGNPDILPFACKCGSPSRQTTGPGHSHPSNCESFDFLSSLLFFSHDIHGGLQPWQDQINGGGIYSAMFNFLESNPTVQGDSFSDRSYEAAWYNVPHFLASQAGGFTGSNLEVPVSQKKRKEVFSFCESDKFGGCSLLTIRSTNNLPSLSLGYSWTTSSNYFQYLRGFCAFSVYNSTKWRLLIDTPPTSLEQDYYKCYNEPWQAFVTSSGLAFANTKALAPFLVLLLVNLLFFWEWFTGRHLPRTYTSAEKDSVLSLLAARVLLEREREARGDRSQMWTARSDSDDKIPPQTLHPTLSALIAELDLGSDAQIFTCLEPSEDAPLPMLLRSAKRLKSAVSGGAPSEEKLSDVRTSLPVRSVRLSRLGPLAASVDRDSRLIV